MTHSFTAEVDKHYIGPREKAVVGELDITSYTSGGESVSASDFGLSSLKRVEIIDSTSDTGHVFRWDNANGAVDAFEPTGSHSHTENTESTYTQNTTTASASSAGSEAAGTTDVGACRVRAVGW